jgi:methyl-accepting chemotaxis protein
MIRSLALKTKMIVSIGGVAVLAFAVTIAFVSVKASRMAKEGSVETADQIAYRYASVVENELDAAMDTARTLAQSFAGIKESGTVPERGMLNGMLKRVLAENPALLGIWAGWEPNALDGKDAEFKNKPGHDATGRFIPYWHRFSGTPEMEPLADYTMDGAGDYYLIPKRSGKETVFDPFVYTIGDKDVLMTSLTMPIRQGGRVIGVAGVDIALNDLNEKISGIRVYGTGFVSIVSANGSYVTHPDASKVGKEVQSADWGETLMQNLASGRGFAGVGPSEHLQGEVYRAAAPISIGNTEMPWAVIATIPMSKVMEAPRSITRMSLIIGAVSLAVLLLVVIGIARSVARPLERIAHGLDESAGQVSAASGQVATSGQQLAEGASEQAAAVEETSSSLEEMASMTRQNADNTDQADRLMQEAKQIVGEASDAMEQLGESMTRMTGASEETQKVVKTIEEIAFQTNLLALNAAVEAARAGEAGAGFAVVADEVRNLAIRAGEAARDTARLIDDNVRTIHESSNIAGRAGEAFHKVKDSSGRMSELIGEVAAASREQAQGIDQINKAVSDMDRVTQQTAANAEESGSAAEEMSAQAREMQAYVQRLRLLVAGGRNMAGGRAGNGRAETAGGHSRTGRQLGESRAVVSSGHIEGGDREMD